VTDRIHLEIGVPEDLISLFESWREHISAQVLAREIQFYAFAGGSETGAAKADYLFTTEGELSDGYVVEIRIRKA